MANKYATHIFWTSTCPASDANKDKISDIQFPQPIIRICRTKPYWSSKDKQTCQMLSNNLVDCFQRVNNTAIATAIGIQAEELRGKEFHQNGVNLYLFRTFRRDITEDKIQEFIYKIQHNIATEADIRAYTDSVLTLEALERLVKCSRVRDTHNQYDMLCFKPIFYHLEG